jgi:hypothetical protein
LSKNSGLRLPDTTDPKIIKFKVIVAFFSVSLLLFGSNALMMTSYSQPQPQKVPSQGEQLLPQQQQQQDIDQQ